jgi:hypothetical protein
VQNVVIRPVRYYEKIQHPNDPMKKIRYPWVNLRENPSERLRVTIIDIWGPGAHLRNWTLAPAGVPVSEESAYATGETTSHLQLRVVDAQRSQATVNIIQVLVIIVMLVTSVRLVSIDARSYIIKPLKAMYELVEVMAREPFSRGQKDHRLKPGSLSKPSGSSFKHAFKSSSSLKPGSLALNDDPSNASSSEIGEVRNALEKISKLFSASYGKIGCVIGEKFTDERQMFDFHLPGKPCGQAILVECGMRDFAVALEAFHDDVLVYLNKILKIVHAAAGSRGGYPGATVGDIVPLVWLPTGIVDSTPALHAAVSAFISVYCDPVLLHFTELPVCQEIVPNYSTRLAFGLHLGSATECILGSPGKADLSLIGPSATITSWLQRATKRYDVPILCSEHFVASLDVTVSALLRRIDRVQIVGCSKPFDVYSYDVPLNDVDTTNLSDGVSAAIFFQDYRPDLPKTFRADFKTACDAYIAGDWARSTTFIKLCLRSEPFDGPSLNIKGILAAHDGRCPPWWSGCREVQVIDIGSVGSYP